MSTIVGTGGGAATAAGMDFQHRVGAHILSSVLCGLPTNAALQFAVLSKISAVHFETGGLVDDLNVYLADGSRVFVQAKRTIHFSDLGTSPFWAVIKSFADNFLRHADEVPIHLLAVSPDCNAPMGRRQISWFR
ncbi:MAG: hypothetical protein GEV13_04090 [Rhodospirillales bacterium]|nr:hypothetical protein [Rhodospirillales bacterium]